MIFSIESRKKITKPRRLFLFCFRCDVSVPNFIQDFIVSPFLLRRFIIYYQLAIKKQLRVNVRIPLSELNKVISNKDHSSNWSFVLCFQIETEEKTLQH